MRLFGGTMYRILIVEDTGAEADRLVACLERYEAEFGERFAITRLSSALEFAEKHPRADLIFMDIDMPGMNGMEAAELLRKRDEETPLVFVTNLAQYAVRGYTVDALDFIVKPVTYADFAPRMARAIKAMKRNAGATVSINTPEGLRVVAVSSIAYVDILRHDLYYHLASKEEPLRIRGSIKQAASELGCNFVKLSSSCLANMAQIRLVRQNSVVMSTGDELFFSRACRKTALETIAGYMGRGM